MGREEDGALVERVRAGDTQAFASLFERWYDRVFNVARAIVRRPELAADVAQDTLLAGWQQLDRLDDVNAFGGWLLKIARHKSLDALRREGRATATDDAVVADLRDRGRPDPTAASVHGDPVEAAEAGETDALLWAASAALGARDASLLDLHLRHGLTPAELAAELGVAPNHAHQLVFRLRKRLEEAIGSFLLWRGGRPVCAALAATAGAAAFDAETAGVIRRHERGCAACQEERRRQTDPTKLFAAVPLVAAPLLLRARSAAALAAEGVPVPDELVSIAGDLGGPGDVSGVEDQPATGNHGRDPALAETAAGGGAGGAGRAGGGNGTDALEDADVDAPVPLWRRRWVAVAAVALVVVIVASLVAADAARAPSGPADAVAASTTAPTLAASTTTAGSPRSGTTTTATPTTSSTTSSTSTTSTTTTTTTPVVVAPVDPDPAPPADDEEPSPDDAQTPPAADDPGAGGGNDPPPPPPPPPPDPTPPPPPPPTSTTTTTSTLPPPPPPPPPAATILRFTLVGASHACDPGLGPHGVGWITENATQVTLSWRGQSAAVAGTGQHSLCLAGGDTVTLTASSTGGSATATVTAP